MNEIPPDSLRAVLDSVFANPIYKWAEAPRPLAFLERWWGALQRWLGTFHDANPQLFAAFFWLLVAILVLIFVHASFVLARTLRAAGAATDVPTGVPATPRDAAWYRRKARRLAETGRFAEAMPLDFRALVLDLDARRVVRYHASKTPNEYAGEAVLPDEQRQMLAEVVRALYATVFARKQFAAEEYAAWLSRTDADRYASAY